MKKNGFLAGLLEVLETVVIVFITVFVLTKFILLPCVVVGSSMESTLLDGDMGYSFIITKKINIKRFDICVIDTEGLSGDKLLVKRVIGLPNDLVEYKNNKLYINGEFVEENFLDDVYTEDLSIKLNDGEYYCLGDNRNISKDSRFYGPFEEERIKSTNYFVLYPFDRFGVK